MIILYNINFNEIFITYNFTKKSVPSFCLSVRYELSQAKVEQGKYLLKEDELQKREQKLKGEKTDMAQYRNNKEQRYAQNYVKHFKKDQR